MNKHSLEPRPRAERPVARPAGAPHRRLLAPRRGAGGRNESRSPPLHEVVHGPQRDVVRGVVPKE